MALMVIEVDHNIDEYILKEIQELPNITQVARVVD
jgi:L-serine dehydratase